MVMWAEQVTRMGLGTPLVVIRPQSEGPRGRAAGSLLFSKLDLGDFTAPYGQQEVESEVFSEVESLHHSCDWGISLPLHSFA